MFYNRKKGRICLVCMDKATTFAPALREQHGTNLQFEWPLKIKRIFF